MEKIILAFPALWVLLEWIRGWIFTGFPWLFLGYSQTNSPLKGYAALLGVYGVSLALTLSSGLIVNAARRYEQKDFKAMYLNLLALAIIWILGGMTSLIPWTIPEGKPLKVALVQGNIPQTIKWSPEHLQFSLERYTSLTEPLWGKTDIIIWPEAAVPIPLQNAETFINELDARARESNTALILGIPIRTPDGSSYYNAIVTLGDKRAVYTKQHLVPFGEYTPFAGLLANALRFMDIPMSEMTARIGFQPPFEIGKVKILPSICYEIAFPDATRSADKSINLLLVVTNDAWFGHSHAEPQHLQMAAMRALEFQKPVLFVSNDGITAIIKPDGQLADSLPQRESLVLNGSVQPMYGLTPWLNNGFDPDLFIIICFIILAVLANRRAGSTGNKTDSTNKRASHARTI